MKNFIPVIFFVFTVSCNSFEKNEEKRSSDSIVKEETLPEPDTSSASSQQQGFRMQTIYTEDGYGYEIFENGNRVIRQPIIPAIQGKKGFATIEDAAKTGTFVVSKLEKGIMPPVITIQELDSLGIKY